MTNLHITMNEFRNESRIIKQTSSILKSGLFKEVYVAALGAEDLPDHDELSSGVKVRRFSLKSRKLSRSLFSQMIKYIEFVLKILFFCKNKNITMVNIHVLGLLPLGYAISVIYGAKLIYDPHELETETAGLGGVRQKLLKVIEKLLIKKARHVFVVSNSIAEWYENEYNIKKPTVLLNSPEYRVYEQTEYLRSTLNISKEKKIALYQGGLSRGRGVELLLSAFKNRNDDKIVLVFMGYGDLEDEVKKVSEEQANIYFHPAVSPEKVLEYTASADFGLLFYENTCLNHFYCSPNKLFEYAMAGLPLLVSNMKDMSMFVHKWNVGGVIKDSTPESVNAAIDELLKKDLNSIKQNALIAAEKNSWRVQEEKMLAVYNSIFNGVKNDSNT